MSEVLTIPKRLAKKGDLVIIPRAQYEEFLSLKRIIPLIKLNKTEKRRVEEGRKQVRKGQFLSLNELKNELGY